MLDRKEVIDAVAQKHDILSSEDDQILSFLEVHDVIFDGYQARFEKAGKLHQERIEQLLAGYSYQMEKVILESREVTRDLLKDRRFKNDNTATPEDGNPAMTVILWFIIVTSLLGSGGLLFYLYG